MSPINTSKLKRFAQFARRLLNEQINSKLEYILKEESRIRRESKNAVNSLEEEIKRTSKEQVIEKVSYIWFNRFCALRYMDINRYNQVGVVSPTGDYIQPEIFIEAKQGHIDEQLDKFIDKVKFNDLISGKVKSEEPQQEAYKLLIVAVCNLYNSLMPFLFEKIADYTELLMPDDLLSSKSVITYIREALLPENCENVEVLGWLYQFYISEKKDDVFEALKSNQKITPENIPAATQLFTPNWIVRYLVQNSLGRLWMLNKPNSGLIEKMDYYIKSEEIDLDFIKIKSPEELKICDPACGSGHMLVYAFELLYSIYEEEGYEHNEIPGLILEKNLFGIEIDDRAGQLAAFALFMKARERYKRFFSKPVKPNICVLKNVEIKPSDLNDYMNEVGRDLFTHSLEETINQFKDADNFGSLIRPIETKVSSLRKLLDERGAVTNLFIHATHNEVLKVLEQVEYLSKRYHVVVANPPYMGANGMNNKLKEFAQKEYAASKADFFAMFIERNLDLIINKGMVAMITMQSWMFLSSYEKLREKIIDQNTIISMAHLGARGFDSIGGEVVQTTAFVIANEYKPDFKGSYLRLIDGKNEAEKKNDFNENRFGGKLFYKSSSFVFKKVPGAPIAYWVSDKVSYIFANSQKLGEIAEAKQGLSTSNNDKFLRLWFEIENLIFGINLSSRESAKETKFKWFPINKGGDLRKWSGNDEYVINWGNDGKELFQLQPKSVVRSPNYYFKKGITWSKVTSGQFSVRFCPEGYIFSDAGMKAFTTENNIFYLTSFMNSKLVNSFMKIISPTLNYEQGNISSLPIIFPKSESTKQEIDTFTQECIDISKEDWDSRETSWDFSKNELLKSKKSDYLSENYQKFCNYWADKFYQLHRNEEELNRLFIKIYELQDELTPDVDFESITILNEEASKNNGKLEFSSQEVIKQFISYSVGCMFGRYSLDKDGLILANQGETLKDFLEKIATDSITFTPCEKNIIPVIDVDWFDDDIVERFRTFLKVSFGENNYNENLSFIENAIGKDIRKDIRKYFLKDFYDDHIKRYKKRPIYWMFSSPKETFNVLIYMHRYRPDTVSIILNDYLREFRSKLTAHLEHMEEEERSSSSTVAQKNKATKEIINLKKQIEEINDYERDTLYPLATEQRQIDLDNGVMVNYKEFGKALKRVPGLS